MRIVVVGGSKFGVATADHLIEKGHEVVLIDKDRQKLERLAEDLDCGMIEGDATSPKTLREAFSSEKDVLIALTNASDDNILTALVGRSVGYGRVIPQIISPELLDVCVELDLKDTITPHVTVARSLCRALEDDVEVARDTNLSGNLRLVRLDVGSGQDGKEISQLGIPDSCRAVAIVHETEERLASANDVVKKGDEILFAAQSEDVEKLKAIFVA